MGHIEALRWHLMRSVIVWLIAAIVIFIFIEFDVHGVIIYFPFASTPSYLVSISFITENNRSLIGASVLSKPP